MNKYFIRLWYGNSKIDKILMKRIAVETAFQKINSQYHRISNVDLKFIPYDCLFKLYFEVYLRNGVVLHLSRDKLKTIPRNKVGCIFSSRVYSVCEIPITLKQVTLNELLKNTDQHLRDNYILLGKEFTKQEYISAVLNANLVCDNINVYKYFAEQTVSDLFENAMRDIKRMTSLRYGKKPIYF
jgi:hypothetical protein